MKMQQEIIHTEFNSNKATLIRVDEGLRMARNCSINDDFEGWFKALSFVRREAWVKMEEAEQKKCKVDFLALEKDMGVVLKSKKRDFANTKIDNKLDDFELFLREIMDKRGMLLKDGKVESGL